MKNNKKPIFTMLKFAGGTLLFFATIFAIIIISLPHFSQPLIEDRLRQAGFTTAKIGSFTAGYTGIKIGELTLDENGSQIGLIDASTSFRDLLHLKLNKLTIKDAAIDLTPFMTAKTSASETSFALPALNIPARQIDISNLKLSMPLAGGKAVFTINGQGSDKDQMVMTIDGVIETPDQKMNGAIKAKAVIDFAQNKASIDLTESSFKTKELTVASGSGHIDIYLTDKPVMEGQLQIDGISYTLADQKPATVPLRLVLTFQPLSSDAGSTGISGTVTDQNGLLSIKVNGKHNIAANTGEANLQMPPTDFVKGVYQLSDISPLSSAYVQDVTGSLGATVKASWVKKDTWNIKTSGTVFLKDVEATVHELVVTKINTVLALQSLTPPVFKEQKVAIGGFESGLPLTNGLMTLSLDDKSRVTLHQASWTLAKGTVTSTAFTVSTKDLTTEATLTAKGLDLSDLFQIAPLEGLSAIGRVNGTLPIKAVSGKVSLVDGVLETEGNGRVSYDPTEVPKFLQDDSNSAIVNLRNALKAFSFDNLKIMLNGDLGGKQKITLKISGNNPDFYNGHPVNLNLNVEGPLESILKYNPGSTTIPDGIRQQLENYESTHAEK